MDLPTNYFITRDVNYVYDYKKFIKGVVVFKIVLTVVVIGFSVSQSNGKGFILNKPFFLEFSSLYFLVNNILKYYLCLLTGYICADYPFKKVF